MARPALAQERVFALRETIARLEGRALPEQAAAEAGLLAERLAECPDRAVAPQVRAEEARLKSNVAAFDQALEGGLPRDALTEIRCLGFRHAGAASGFALSLAALLQAAEPDGTGRPSGSTSAAFSRRCRSGRRMPCGWRRRHWTADCLPRRFSRSAAIRPPSG